MLSVVVAAAVPVVVNFPPFFCFDASFLLPFEELVVSPVVDNQADEKTEV